jgi:hypothetical protein
MSTRSFAHRLHAPVREAAGRAADAEIHWLTAEGQRQGAAHQSELDAWWHELLANDPGAVLGALIEAFEDNEATAAPIGVHGDEVSVVI